MNTESRPIPPWKRSKEQLAQGYRDLRRENRTRYGRWLLLIKELRVLHEASILEAERIALSNPHRRRWVEMLINTHPKGRKAALEHIRFNGQESLARQNEGSFIVDLG